jgi:hypothetical protein
VADAHLRLWFDGTVDAVKRVEHHIAVVYGDGGGGPDWIGIR